MSLKSRIGRILYDIETETRKEGVPPVYEIVRRGGGRVTDESTTPGPWVDPCINSKDIQFLDYVEALGLETELEAAMTKAGEGV